MPDSVLFTILSMISLLWTQGREEDYLRANQLRERFRNKVFKAEINPHWSPDNSRFWYLNRLSDGRKEFISVNVETGERTPAFDHQSLAAVLSAQSGHDIDPERLPVDQLIFSEQRDQWRFYYQENLWQFNSVTNHLQALATEASPSQLESGIRPTQRTGEETLVTFRNQTTTPIKLFWLDSQGHQKYYSTLEVDADHQQHTFAGHIWLLTDLEKRHFGIYETRRQNPLVVITGDPLPTDEKKVEPPDASAEAVPSPDGSISAFIQNHNLWLRPIGNQARQLSSDGVEGDSYNQSSILWSPDGSKLVVSQTLSAQKHPVHLIESSPDDQVQPKLHTFQYLKPGDRIDKSQPCLFDVATYRQIPIASELFPNPWSLSHFRWAEDSSSFTFLYNQRGHQILRLISVDANTGHTKPILTETSPTFIDYSQKMHLHWLNGGEELIWMSERDGWNHLYLYDALNHQLQHQITKGEWVVRRVDHVDPEKRQIWFQASGLSPTDASHPVSDPYYIHYGRIDLDGSNLVWLTSGDGTHNVQWSPDRRFLIDTWSRVDMAPVHQLRSARDGSFVCDLERADWKKLLEAGWSIPRQFVSKGRDDSTDIYGIIWRPTNFDPQKKYPVIEHIYAGPHSAFVPKAFQDYYHQQEMAELGFIIVQIDGMGTNWRSKEFHDYCWQNLRDAGFPDRIAWIRQAAKIHAEMDLSRVGIYGGSAGGQNTLSGLLHHGDFYHVGVADCGCHDNRMDKIWWNEAWMGWPIDQHYADNSNVTHAEKLQGKLLLVVGELDRNVDPASTMQVVNALIIADKDFDLLVIPGAGHGAVGTVYGTRRQRDFFVRHLLGKEPRSSK